jgi:magnesium transporter
MNRDQAVPAAPSPAIATRVLLLDADGRDRVIPLESLQLQRLSPRELAWVDVLSDDPSALIPLLQSLDLAALPLPQLLAKDSPPLCSRQDWFAARATAPVWRSAEHFEGEPWLLAVGAQVVITVHRAPLQFLDDLFEHEDPESRLGALTTDSFAAALLDRMLTLYFNAIDAFEDMVDAMEVAILQPRVHARHLPQLRQLRRALSVLRHLLTSHRDLFDAMARPDFRPESETGVVPFAAVSARYERAVDAIENARDLVIGSFEMLATRLSQRTNDSMRMLTFATVLLGSLAVIAGVLGMNFDAPLFDTGARGFWITIGLMTGIVVAAIGYAMARGWWR